MSLFKQLHWDEKDFFITRMGIVEVKISKNSTRKTVINTTLVRIMIIIFFFFISNVML